MKNALLCIGFFVCLWSVNAKYDFFPAYTQKADWNEGEDFSMIKNLAKYLVNEAQEAEENDGGETELENQNDLTSEEAGPPFAYNANNENSKVTDEIHFAYGPNDPRYYQDSSDVYETNNQDDSEWSKRGKEIVTSSSQIETNTEGATKEDKPYHSAIYQIPINKVVHEDDQSDLYFTALVAGCCAIAVVGIVAIGISCYKLQKNAKAAADVEYPAYGITGPNKDVSPTSGDRRLAQSAQMYHYQHQKQQIIAMERATNERHGSISDAESDEENEEGDYTVYECPGLASTGEMEVKNPLFHDDPTPASPAKQGIEATSEHSQELPK